MAPSAPKPRPEHFAARRGCPRTDQSSPTNSDRRLCYVLPPRICTTPTKTSRFPHVPQGHHSTRQSSANRPYALVALGLGRLGIRASFPLCGAPDETRRRYHTAASLRPTDGRGSGSIRRKRCRHCTMPTTGWCYPGSISRGRWRRGTTPKPLKNLVGPPGFEPGTNAL